MRTEIANFAGADGQQLSGRLDLPAGSAHGTPIRAVALFAHCFTCGKDLRSIKTLSARLTDHGVAVLRFDFTGLGASDGDFEDTNFSSNVSDLLAAADWLRQSYGAPSLMVGHSFGGTAVLAAAHRIPELKAVATIGAPAAPEHVTHLFGSALDGLGPDDAADVSIGGRPFRMKGQFLADVTGETVEACMARLAAPVLVMHSPADTIVDFSNALKIQTMAAAPVSLVALNGADHLLQSSDDAQYAADMLSAWASRHLPSHVAASDDVLVPAAEGEVVVAERGTGKFAQVIRIGDRHALLADEPLGIGDDTGPAPYDMLLAALGACTSMTIRMYAERKDWPVDDIAVKLRHSKVHAKDCEECDTVGGKVDIIDRELFIEGDLDDEQRARLFEIADMCPVHRSLHSETLIRTR